MPESTLRQVNVPSAIPFIKNEGAALNLFMQRISSPQEA